MNKPAEEREFGMLPRELIETKARKDIGGYLVLRGESDIYQATRNLSQNVSDDYGNRFLVELIQNAHDAHLPDARDGEIVVQFAPEDTEFGCLYVANRGNGFSAPNFKAITNIAMSSKSVNEGIGNKGLGFRSVLQICQWPEIYSSSGSEERGTFDGYCFRFATTEDIAAFISDQPNTQTLAEEIQRKMPFWYLPVYAADRPGQVPRFAQEGFSTVVRMPLASAKARKLVEQQLNELLSTEHPLHLFLERVQRIRIEAASGNVKLLTRMIREQWTLESGLTIKRLAVGDDEYLLADRALPDESFRNTLEHSIASGDVPASWRDWQGESKVCIAVRLGRSVEDGLLYCFLPLGKGGQAPFAGYINANFHTKMDRTSVKDRVGLNCYFIEKALEISRNTIEFLIERNWPESPGAVADLLCWQAPYDTKLRGMLGAGAALLDRCLLPTLNASGHVRWSKVRDTRLWVANSDASLSASALTRVVDTAILLDGLSEIQRDGIVEFFSKAGHYFEPGPGLVAEWIERIAQDLLDTNAPPEKWADFYDEVAAHMVSAGKELSGRKFLLSVGRQLIAAEIGEGSPRRRRRAADVYFSPVMTLDADVDGEEARRQLPLEQFPVSLQQGFVFLSRELPWSLEGGGYRRSRAFFLQTGLVREYNTGDVIRTLARITRGDHLESLKLQALEWAFRLSTSGRSLGEKEIHAVDLFVPTRGGWYSAKSAMFGIGWADCANGKKLESLLKVTSEYSSEMRDLQQRLIPVFGDWGIDFGGEEEWSRFLHHAGVRGHLKPIASDDIIQKTGRPHELPSLLATAPLGLTKTSIKIFLQTLQKLSTRLRHSSVSYRCELSPWRMPGLCESERFEEKTRIAYAVQVILAISGFSKESLQFRIFRPGNPPSSTDQQSWPTPLAVLLREIPWMPISRGSGVVRFVKPREAWEFDTDEDSMPPRFIELVVSPVQRLLQAGVRNNLRTQTELRTLNHPDYASAALAAFAETAARGLFEPRDVRRFRELFRCAWDCAATAESGIRLDQIPVMRGENIAAVTCKIDDEETQILIYFVDAEDAAKQKLLEELQLPVFDFDSPAVREDSWAWLEGLAPGRFIRLSDVRLDVLADGTKFDEKNHAPLLSEELGAWAVDFIVSVAAHKSGKFLQFTQNTLGNIRRAGLSLRVLTARQVQISMAGKVVNLPASLRGAVVVWREQEVVLVIETKDSGLRIEVLAHVAEQLAVALGYPGLASPLETAFLRLLRIYGETEGGAPSDETVADALGVSVDKIREVRQYARTDLSGLIRFARLLALCKDLPEAAERLAEMGNDDVPAEEEVREAMSPVAAAFGISLDDLLARLGEAYDARDLMHEFYLPLAKLNEAIGSLDEFKPVSNEKFHRHALDAYLSQHHDSIVERIRNTFLTVFDRDESLEAYVSLRGRVSSISANPDWFMRLDELPDEILEKHVIEWLQGQGLPTEHVEISAPPLKDCRDKNREQLWNLWKLYGPIISAWVRLTGSGITPLMHDAWQDPSQKRQEYAQRAHDDGWMDFRYLDDALILKRLIAYGIWPADKPLSTEMTDWGISETAMQLSQAAVESARESARKKRLRINLDGSEFSAEADDFKRLAEVVARNLDAVDALKNTNDSFRTLHDAISPASSGHAQGGGPTGKGRRFSETTLSDEQKLAVGLVGELYAMEWIKRFHRSKHGIELGDSCWVSGYRNTLLGDSSGNDSLGYDFVVKLKGGTCYYYEVKASQGDWGVFEMGPTEISAAHRYRADGDNKYRVLYVSHATDRRYMRIDVLPNPFSSDGSKKLRAVGRGSVTFEFNFGGR